MKKLGLIAGNGKFPLLFAAEAKREGYTVVAVAHRGETPEEIERLADDVIWIQVGQLGKIIRTFKNAGVTQAVMAGGIGKVKLFGNFRPDLRGITFLARLKSREDDALLRGAEKTLLAVPSGAAPPVRESQNLPRWGERGAANGRGSLSGCGPDP